MKFLWEAVIFSFLNLAPCFCVRIQSRDILPSYDFVVVGGGISGMVVANRLSEDPNTSVLVLEAGELDQGEDTIYVPLIVGLFGGAVGTKYDWNLSYTPQASLNGRVVPITIGKGIGGGSLLNRMLFDRGSKADYARWNELGNKDWDWSTLLPYFRKSEKFTPPKEKLAAEFDIQFEPSAHGFDGNVQSSYPPFIWPSSNNFFESMKLLGIRKPLDGAGGDAVGVFWATQTLDPDSRTRSNARTAYYNTSYERPNLKVLTGHQVTKLLINTMETGVLVSGVEYVTSSNSSRQTVTANKEIIVSAGAIHTPQLLELSGIGDPSILSGFEIETIVDLPGVGSNFQDHTRNSITNILNVPLTVSNLTKNATFNAEMRALYDVKRIGPYSTEGVNSLAFLPLPFFSNQTPQIYTTTLSQNINFIFPSTLSPSILCGYTAQRRILLRDLKHTNISLLEIIYSDGTLTASLQHPFSRGTIHIQSLSPFVPPLIDPNYLSNPTDLTLIKEGFKFLRTIMSTPPTLALNPIEIAPGPSVQSDSDIEQFIRNNLTTLYHPSGTAALMKREFGGVVDGQLKVYGVRNLRVVDASVIPMLPATHIQSTVYALAERAAGIIKKTHGLS